MAITKRRFSVNRGDQYRDRELIVQEVRVLLSYAATS